MTRARGVATALLAAALTVAGPGTAALQAGEAPSERGQPSESSSPGSRAPERPPGQESTDPDGSAGSEEPQQGGEPAADEPADQEPGPSPTGGPDASPTGASQPSEPPPSPQPDLTGTRVLRSRLGPPRAGTTDDGDAVALRDLHVVVTENDAAGIDGGWWVTVATSMGEIAVDVPASQVSGAGGAAVPRTAYLRRGSLLSVKGQHSSQRYQELYEAVGTLRLQGEHPTERPVITVLLVQ